MEMIKIYLTPQGGQPQKIIEWNSPVLIINNEQFDLSLLEDGATAKNHRALGTVRRTGDDYECMITLGHGSNAPEETRFPQPITATLNGVIELPPYDVLLEDLGGAV
jgi:hypothetical protein